MALNPLHTATLRRCLNALAYPLPVIPILTLPRVFIPRVPEQTLQANSSGERMALGSRSFLPTRRDVFVACVSAFCALLWFQTSQSHQFRGRRDEDNWPHHGSTRQNPLDTAPIAGGPAGGAMSSFMPSTTVLAHHAGWTLFENLYMYNGTLLVISDQEWTSFPERRLMTSTGRHPPNLCNLP